MSLLVRYLIPISIARAQLAADPSPNRMRAHCAIMSRTNTALSRKKSRTFCGKSYIGMQQPIKVTQICYYAHAVTRNLSASAW